jgi:hypothetical protein
MTRKRTYEVTASVTVIGVPDVLAALLPAVNGIHGGCMVCLEHFTERANAALADLGQPQRYVVTRQADNANLGVVAMAEE